MFDIKQGYTFKNGIQLRNKFVLAPMTTYSSNMDLTLSDEEEVYYNARAKSFGMIITAATAVSKDAQAFVNQISIRDDRYLDSMTKLAKSIKKEGAVAICQLHHGGRMNVPGLQANQRIVGPSAIKANREYAVVPEALKTSEIYDIIDDFKNAVKRAYNAGFDGIELHGANTYLIQQFVSASSNKRTDEFGGSIQDRLRFVRLLLEAVFDARKTMLRPFIIGYRLSPEEIEEDGITLDDTIQLVHLLKSFNLDYIHLSIRRYDATSLRDENDKVAIVERIQAVIRSQIPLIGVGAIHGKKAVEEANELGLDLFGIGMAALADPDVPNKIMSEEPLKMSIDKDSLLPEPLFKRLGSWSSGLSDKGFIIKTN